MGAAVAAAAPPAAEVGVEVVGGAALVAGPATGALVAPCVVAPAEAAVPGAFAELAPAEALAPGTATDPPTDADAPGAFADAPLVDVACADATDTHKSDASIPRAAFRSLITEPSPSVSKVTLCRTLLEAATADPISRPQLYQDAARLAQSKK